MVNHQARKNPKAKSAIKGVKETKVTVKGKVPQGLKSKQKSKNVQIKKASVRQQEGRTTPGTLFSAPKDLAEQKEG